MSRRTERRNRILSLCCAGLIGVALWCASRYEAARREASALRAELKTERSEPQQEPPQQEQEPLAPSPPSEALPDRSEDEPGEPYVLIATIPFGIGLEPALDALKQADIPHEGDGSGDDTYAVRVPPADAEAARRVLKRVAAEQGSAINFWEEGEKD